jgi:tyrosinase
MHEWDEVLLWYARAVRHMQQRHETDPTSWRYQANVHGNQPEGQRPGEWDECEHQTWFFLPWHRAYLFCWETIVQAAIVQLGGPAEWSLPYWNYSDAHNPQARILPPAFRAHTLPDGTPNPLRCQRGSTANSGQVIFKPSHVSLAALNEHYFEGGPHGGSTGFGGPMTGFPNHFGNASGVLENVPHNAVHVDIAGLMLDPDTAARDPIFWLHHANIDRLWMVWLQNAAHKNASARAWLNATYRLHDTTGRVTFTAAQVLDPLAAPLSYTYEGLAAPGGARTPPSVPTPPAQQTPEMLGATDAPVALAADHVHASLRLEPPSGPAAGMAIGADEGPRVHLNLENITGETGAVNYDVYVDLPEGSDPEQYPELLAGVLAPFGIARSSTRRDPHTGGSGLNAAFDITSIVSHLQTEGAWDPSIVRVSFVPTVGDDQPAPVTVGRISVYVTP